MVLILTRGISYPVTLAQGNACTFALVVKLDTSFQIHITSGCPVNFWYSTYMTIAASVSVLFRHADNTTH